MTNKLTVSDDVGDAAVLVCSRLTTPLIFADNERGVCAECGRAIQFRPHAPRHMQRVCMACALPRMEAGAAKGELEVTVTPTTVAEVALFCARAKGNA
jgi:hypothetical protein